MKHRNVGSLPYRMILGMVFVVAGIVSWMRFTSDTPNGIGAFRNRDALISVAAPQTSMLIEDVSGMLVGGAAEADSVEIWSVDGGLLLKISPTSSRTFSGHVVKTSSADISIVARCAGRLISSISGANVIDFNAIHLGEDKSVTFTTRFLDLEQNPVNVHLVGQVRVGRITIPLDTKRDIVVTSAGYLYYSGLPVNGFVSFDITNQEYARTVALVDVALRSEPLRRFPNVKVYRANRIKGQITDRSGRARPNAKVILESNIRRFQIGSQRTDDSGFFTFTRLPNGMCSVQGVSDSQDDMCTVPVSAISCRGGQSVNIGTMTMTKGNVVKFVVDDKSQRATETVFIEIDGSEKGRRWSITRIVSSSSPTKLLLPPGHVHFQASQQPRNGILPSFRNVQVTPQKLNVKPLSMQKVVVRIATRRL